MRQICWDNFLPLGKCVGGYQHKSESVRHKTCNKCELAHASASGNQGDYLAQILGLSKEVLLKKSPFKHLDKLLYQI